MYEERMTRVVNVEHTDRNFVTVSSKSPRPLKHIQMRLDWDGGTETFACLPLAVMTLVESVDETKIST